MPRKKKLVVVPECRRGCRRGCGETLPALAAFLFAGLTES